MGLCFFGRAPAPKRGLGRAMRGVSPSPHFGANVDSPLLSLTQTTRRAKSAAGSETKQGAFTFYQASEKIYQASEKIYRGAVQSYQGAVQSYRASLPTDSLKGAFFFTVGKHRAAKREG